MASKHFADLLEEEFKPTELVLNDTDAATTKAVVDFSYSGNIDLTDENAEKILEIAHSACIDLLIDKCRQFYSEKLVIKNAATTLIVANHHGFRDLREQARKLICDEFDTLPIMECQKLSAEMFQELLGNENIHSELGASRLLAWFQNDEGGRGEHMPGLLKRVRVESLTAEVCFG